MAAGMVLAPKGATRVCRGDRDLGGFFRDKVGYPMVSLPTRFIHPISLLQFFQRMAGAYPVIDHQLSLRA